MKKTHLIIVMLSVLVAFISFVTSMPVAAQTVSTRANKIRNTFYECKLGVTTRSEVITKLKSLGYSPKNGEFNYVRIKKAKFANVMWDRCYFNFAQDTLRSVSFFYYQQRAIYEETI